MRTQSQKPEIDRVVAMRTFVRVAELRSFTQAAAQLGMPRATVSTTIQALEETLGTKLLQRTTRKVDLTTDGASFIERCRVLLSDVEELETMFQPSTERLRGKVRVDMASSLARDAVIPKLPEFFERYPGVELELVGVDRKVDLLREGIDCTVRGGPLEPGLGAVDLELPEVDFVNAASPAYLERFGRPRRLEDLSKHHLVHYATELGQPPEGFEYFDGTRVRQVPMKGVITVSTIDAYKAAALAGLGLCQNPRIGVREYLKRGELVEVLPRFRPAPGGNARIVYPLRSHTTKRVRAFIDWVGPVLQAYFRGR